MKMVITCIADCVVKEDRYMVATIASNLFVNNAFWEILVELQSQKLKAEANGNVTFVAQKNSKNQEIAPRKFTIGSVRKEFLEIFRNFWRIFWKKILKCPDQTNKSVKLHDKYLEEKQLNSEKRKLEKFEKQKAKKMESVLVKTSGEKVKFFISIPN